eukprot:EG_transcript_992
MLTAADMFPSVALAAAQAPRGHHPAAMQKPMMLPPRLEAWEGPVVPEWLSPVQVPGGFMVPPSPVYSFTGPATPLALPILTLDAHSPSVPQTPLRVLETPPPSSPPAKENHTNVYISGLPRAVTDEVFLELVSQFGQIFSSKVVRKTTTDPPVGFVQYTAPGAAQRAVATLDGRVFGGATLKAKMALRDKDKGVDSKPSANLYICNLPTSFTTADLRRTFEPHGRIVSLVALTDPVTGRSRGTGFVRFSSVKEARLAKEAMHGFLLRPDLPLEVKFAESNAERTQRLKGRADGSPTTPLSPLPVFPLPPASPPALTLPPTPTSALLASAALCPVPGSFHKRGRPTPLKAPTASPPAEGAPEPFLEGLDDLKAFLDNVFPPEQHQNAAGRLAAELRLMEKAQQQGKEMVISHRKSWESFDASEPSPGHLTSEMFSPVEGVWVKPTPAPWSSDEQSSQGTAISESRIWQFAQRTDSPTSGKDVSPPSPAGPTLSTSSTIKIEGLPEGTSEVDLYRLCSPYGAIMQINLDPGHHGCTAFVQFRCPENAGDAQAKLHGMWHGGAVLAVTA